MSTLWHITEALANQRKGNFTGTKKLILDAFCVNKQEIVYFEFGAADFISSINTIVNTPGAGGLRIVYASFAKPTDGSMALPPELDPEIERKMTLLLAPTQPLTGTILNGSAPIIWQNIHYINVSKTAGGDLVSNFQSIAVTPDNMVRLQRWMNYYQLIKLPALEAPGLSVGFNETKSLWYTKETFIATGPDEGILEFLLSNPGYDKVRISLSAQNGFGNDPFPNQMDLVFELIDETNGTIVYTGLHFHDVISTVLSDANMSRISKNNALVTLVRTFGDTGIPCPPLVCS